MNRTNVERLLVHLRELRNSQEASRFNMVHYGTQVLPDSWPDKMLERPDCNTQACYAGETILVFGSGFIAPEGGIVLNDESRPTGYMLEDEAARLLGLTEDQAVRLFYVTSGPDPGWPFAFETAYYQARTPADRLDVAIDRLEHFLMTDGAE